MKKKRKKSNRKSFSKLINLSRIFKHAYGKLQKKNWASLPDVSRDMSSDKSGDVPQERKETPWVVVLC